MGQSNYKVSHVLLHPPTHGLDGTMYYVVSPPPPASPGFALRVIKVEEDWYFFSVRYHPLILMRYHPLIVYSISLIE